MFIKEPAPANLSVHIILKSPTTGSFISVYQKLDKERETEIEWNWQTDRIECRSEKHDFISWLQKLDWTRYFLIIFNTTWARSISLCYTKHLENTDDKNKSKNCITSHFLPRQFSLIHTD